MRMESSNPRKSIPSFFKILLDETATNLPLPPVFVKKQFLEGRFPENPVLKTESGEKWGVKILKIGEKYCFGEGWLEFVKDTKTQVGDFLVFWLIGKSTFEVSIFGPNGCQKDLSSTTPTTSKCVCNCGSSKIAKSYLSEITKPVIKVEDEDEDDDDEDDEKEIELQNLDWMEESMNPCFEKVLHKTHTSVMTLPSSFVWETGIENQRETVLRNKEGKEWPVNIRRCGDGRVYLGYGWFNFRKDNKLMEGDTCSFQYCHSKGGRNSFIQFELVKKVPRKRGRPPLNRSLRP